MVHRASEPASAPIGHPAVQFASPDPRPWKIHRNRCGTPRWYQRWLEAWWILTGEWSLHRAWQSGKDRGGIDEYRRIVINGGDLGRVIDATIYSTCSHVLNGSEPMGDLMPELRRKAWQRYRRDDTIFGLAPDLPLNNNLTGAAADPAGSCPKP